MQQRLFAEGGGEESTHPARGGLTGGGSGLSERDFGVEFVPRMKNAWPMPQYFSLAYFGAKFRKDDLFDYKSTSRLCRFIISNNKSVERMGARKAW